ncbi:phage tail protein [Chitinophaga caeni]|uniref:Phage tail protein n=1 Tax=Chitinophaga caeni TaxID=2029983 RepID=A0A291QWV3_9BACT|nr:tail fiber protein [Chitinophaga caeni]ATL48362.1 phage tail protein [Chitinophaga caeni]
MDEVLAIIKIFGGNYAPTNFMFCQGQLLAINSNEVLYAIIGNTYGGNGVTTFQLPDLRGRTPIGQGQGPGLTNRTLGERSGAETVTLLLNQMPAHTHGVMNVSAKLPVSSATGTSNIPGDNKVLASIPRVGSGPTARPVLAYAEAGATADTYLQGGSVQATVNTTGGNQPHNNMQPYLTLNFIICTVGLFPSRA